VCVCVGVGGGGGGLSTFFFRYPLFSSLKIVLIPSVKFPMQQHIDGCQSFYIRIS
jgi:hypothetical protein